MATKEKNKLGGLTMPDSLYETRPQGIMVVVFGIAKSLISFVEFNSHDSLQTCVIDGIGHCLVCRLIVIL